jgi:hypothetical protein
MLVHIPKLLDAGQVRLLRDKLDHAGAPWVDGRVTAGHQGVLVKHNRQLDEGSVLARDLGDIILGALERNPLFISAALPDVVYPPMFNRYEGGMSFGNHVDGAIRLIPGTGMKLRTDLSATLFLCAPEEYDGGELLIDDTFGSHAIKPRDSGRTHRILFLGAKHGARRCAKDPALRPRRRNPAPQCERCRPIGAHPVDRLLSQSTADVVFAIQITIPTNSRQ